MHTDPAPLSDDGADLPLIPGPAISRPSQPHPAQPSSTHELVPPFVSPIQREEKLASVEIDTSVDVGEAVEIGSTAESGETADVTSPAAHAEAEPGVQHARGDDLAWLSAIDWGDDQRSAEEAPALEAPMVAEEERPEHTADEPASAPAPFSAAPAAGVPDWMSWVNDDADPVDPDAATQDDAAELPIVEIESLLAAEEADEELQVPLAELEPALEESEALQVEDSWVDASEEERIGMEVQVETSVWTNDTAFEEEAGLDEPSWSADEAVETEAAFDSDPDAEITHEDSAEDSPAEEPPVLVSSVDGHAEPTAEAEPAEEPAESTGAAVADGSLEELAGKLERLAASLRSGSLADVVAGASSSDPLEVLLAGYALGYSRARGSAGEQAG